MGMGFGASFNDDHEEGSMFGPKLGTWWVSSRKDPRWNNSGADYGLVCAGGPSELHKWFEECQEKYGTPPDDCEFGFMKD